MATKKISELAPLSAANAQEGAAVPIVNSGTTNKLTLNNLRGALRGASNTGDTCAGMVGGINNIAGKCAGALAGVSNTACRVGDGVLGGQNNTVDANFLAQTSDSSYRPGPHIKSSGSMSTIMGGLNNFIAITSQSAYSNVYPLMPSAIINSVDSMISSSGIDVPINYSHAGDNMILGGFNAEILGPSTDSAAYTIGHNLIQGGLQNRMDFTNFGAGTNSAAYKNTIMGGWCSTICSDDEGKDVNRYMASNHILAGHYSEEIHGRCGNGNTSNSTWYNVMVGSGGSCMAATEYSGMFGAWNSRIINSGYATIVGGQSNEIGNWGDPTLSSNKSGFSTIVGGTQNKIPGGQLGAIIGGVENTIPDTIDCAVILGGDRQTATVVGGTHVQQLVIKSTAIPTSDPGVLGQVYVDQTAGNVLKISL
jgi:hypothetical protein